jgi:rhodanese-related sulfurtransferase
LNWNAITAIASAISTVAFVLTALYIRAELKSLDKDRYLNVTSELFSVWQSKEFMEAHLWLIHGLEETTWESFVENHRGDYGEIAFHRVGAFYDRVGTLTRLGIINEWEILSTMGAYAIAAWQKIGPLVKEARKIENSNLFDDYEKLLPACHECYVPSLGQDAQVHPFSLAQRNSRISVPELKRRLDRGDPVTILDVRPRSQLQIDPRSLPGAVWIPLDRLENDDFSLPKDREVIAFCACPDEASSARAARILQEKGYRARALTGGYNEWREADYPMEEIRSPV